MPSNRSSTNPALRTKPTPKKWKLRPPAAILGLRICDPAVGSGAILTAAGRYLADRLIESVVEHGSGEGPFATRLSDLANAPPEEQVVLARREIVDHCLYGVDKNPVAAEMAKLSLWLTTMARERPFTFLDHAIQVGDSLLGITDLEQLRWLHLEPDPAKGQSRLHHGRSRSPPQGGSRPGARASRTSRSSPFVMHREAAISRGTPLQARRPVCRRRRCSGCRT